MSEIPEDIRNAARKAFAEAMCFNTDHESEEVFARAILAERERHGWQPIETAPKGVEVIVWADGLPEARACFDRFSTDPYDWHDMRREMPSGGQWLWTYLDGGPTHWMPIPESPKP